MDSIKVPDGWCPECNKKALDKIDLSQAAKAKLESLKKRMLVSFMIGDRDGALAEISYQLGITPGELSVAGPWESPALTQEMAFAIAEEIFQKFPEVLERLFERHGFYETARKKDEYRRREMEYMDRKMRGYESYSLPPYREPMDQITPAKKEYYIPPWTLKKNDRGDF